MRDVIPDHPFTDNYVDFDWRNNKEKHLPYDFMNKNVVQGWFVDEVRVDCEGKEWCYCRGRSMPQPANKVCRVYSSDETPPPDNMV